MSILIVSSLLISARSSTVTVSTRKGDIIGQVNDGYNTFFGVPYAKVDEDNPFGVSICLFFFHLFIAFTNLC